jgi:hypothetical protein
MKTERLQPHEDPQVITRRWAHAAATAAGGVVGRRAMTDPAATGPGSAPHACAPIAAARGERTA